MGLIATMPGNDSEELIESIVGEELDYLGKYEFGIPDICHGDWHYNDPMLSYPDETVYLVIKAGNMFEVWRVPAPLNPFNVLTYKIGGKDISHVTAYTTIPESASSILLGIAMLGFIVWRRLWKS